MYTSEVVSSFRCAGTALINHVQPKLVPSWTHVSLWDRICYLLQSIPFSRWMSAASFRAWVITDISKIPWEEAPLDLRNELVLIASEAVCLWPDQEIIRTGWRQILMEVAPQDLENCIHSIYTSCSDQQMSRHGFHPWVTNSWMSISRVYSPLCGMLCEMRSRAKFASMPLTYALRSVVRELQALGLNLVRVGEMEANLWRIFLEDGLYNVSKIYRGYSPVETVTLVPHMIGFSYGPDPEDWYAWENDPTDSLAGIFWKLIESPCLPVPGAYPEEEDTVLILE